MTITNSSRLMDIQKEFNAKFPYLKLEFYAKHHDVGEGSPNKLKLDPHMTIGEFRANNTSGDLSINGHLKVSTLESNFFEQFGLNVQVFRKSGSIWLQTTATDEWTLAKQNTKGEEWAESSATE